MVCLIILSSNLCVAEQFHWYCKYTNEIRNFFTGFPIGLVLVVTRVNVIKWENVSLIAWLKLMDWWHAFRCNKAILTFYRLSRCWLLVVTGILLVLVLVFMILVIVISRWHMFRCRQTCRCRNLTCSAIGSASSRPVSAPETILGE